MFEFDTTMSNVQQTSLYEPNSWSPEYVIANKSACDSALEVEEVLQNIPLINYKPLHEFKHMQLVRFHGMIQDMRDPEYYFKAYEVKNTQTGKCEVRRGIYNDSLTCLPNEEILFQSKNNQYEERYTLIVISIPGLNEWVYKQYTLANSSNTEARCSQKRSLGDDSFESIRKKEKLSLNAETIEETDSMENEKYKGSAFSKEFILNLPIPTNEGKACIVKLYDGTFSLNETVEVVGFISLQPISGSAHNSDETMTEAEIVVHYPPPSIVPRIHAIKVIPLNKKPIISMPEIILNKAELIRSDLHLLLSELLFGDELAANYLICHLLSSIHMRRDLFLIGPYPLNITNFPLTCKEFSKNLYKFLTLLVRKSHLLELTLDNLNNLTLVPKKDYECNRLNSGLLQLSKNTLLVLDETGLAAGKLTKNGRDNYDTISDLISMQKLIYDFKFYKLEYDSDIQVLILSEAKSFIPCNNQIPLKIKSESENNYSQVTKMAEEYLKNEERLENIRLYLEVVRDKKFVFEDTELSQEIQYDLTHIKEMRNADKMNSLMVLAKLMALSHGSDTLTREHWKKAVQMEMDRFDRLVEKK